MTGGGGCWEDDEAKVCWAGGSGWAAGLELGSRSEARSEAEASLDLELIQ